MYTVLIKHEKLETELTWNGETMLPTHPIIQELIEIEIEDGIPPCQIPGYPPIDPQDVYSHGAHLFVMLSNLFESVEVIRGELPVLESVPDDAIP